MNLYADDSGNKMKLSKTVSLTICVIRFKMVKWQLKKLCLLKHKHVIDNLHKNERDFNELIEHSLFLSTITK